MKKKYIIEPEFSGAISVKMRVLGIFWVTVKTFDSDNVEDDYLKAERLLEKLEEK